jgi:uncharacterized integral membrane protein
MFSTLTELGKLVMKSKKIWVVPIVLFLIIIALLIVAAQTSPVPVFLYPIL